MTPGELATLLALVRVLVEGKHTARPWRVVTEMVRWAPPAPSSEGVGGDKAIKALRAEGYYWAGDESGQLAAIDRAIATAEARE